jgi:hypothetical protein
MKEVKGFSWLDAVKTKPKGPENNPPTQYLQVQLFILNRIR